MHRNISRTFELIPVPSDCMKAACDKEISVSPGKLWAGKGRQHANIDSSLAIWVWNSSDSS